jgi:hypothetical protein
VVADFVELGAAGTGGGFELDEAADFVGAGAVIGPFGGAVGIVLELGAAELVVFDAGGGRGVVGVSEELTL